MRSPSKIGVSTVMSKKCPADSQGSLVMTTSPGLRLLAKMRTRCAPAMASELMWPGVPVLACATMRPRRSNSAQARSPASRTIGLKAMRCSALARSVTMPIRLRPEDFELDAVHCAHPFRAKMQPILSTVARPARRDHGGGLALLDDRRALDALAGGERCCDRRPARIARRSRHAPPACRFGLPGAGRRGSSPG